MLCTIRFLTESRGPRLCYIFPRAKTCEREIVISSRVNARRVTEEKVTASSDSSESRRPFGNRTASESLLTEVLAVQIFMI